MRHANGGRKPSESPRRHFATRSGESVRVGHILDKVYDCICGGDKINRPGINLGKRIDLAASVSV